MNLWSLLVSHLCSFPLYWCFPNCFFFFIDSNKLQSQQLFGDFGCICIKGILKTILIFVRMHVWNLCAVTNITALVEDVAMVKCRLFYKIAKHFETSNNTDQKSVNIIVMVCTIVGAYNKKQGKTSKPISIALLYCHSIPFHFDLVNVIVRTCDTMNIYAYSIYWRM